MDTEPQSRPYITNRDLAARMALECYLTLGPSRVGRKRFVGCKRAIPILWECFLEGLAEDKRVRFKELGIFRISKLPCDPPRILFKPSKRLMGLLNGETEDRGEAI